MKRTALKTVGRLVSRHSLEAFFVAVIMAGMAMPAAAASLMAYYPLDSYYWSGGSPGVGVPRTANTAPGSTWGDASLNYSSGALFQSQFVAGMPGISTPGNMAYQSDATTGGRISFGTMDPFSYTGSFTYSLWVWDPFTTTGGLQSMLLSKQTANNNHYFRVILRSGAAGGINDDMQIGAYNGTTGSGTFQDRNTGSFVAAGVPDPSTNWVHIAVTGSKSGSTATWQVYANGQPLSMANNTTILDATRAAIGMTLGVTSGGQAQSYPNLKVDDIRFYDGVLSQSEIVALVPEPSAITMLAMGLGGLALLRLRRR